MFTAQFAGTFLKQLQERKAKWAAGPQVLAARIHIENYPFDMSWWYYHEHGTVAHEIPKEQSEDRFVVYTSHGVKYIANVAYHPGNKALHIVQNLRNEMIKEMQPIIHKAFITTPGIVDNPTLIRPVLEDAVYAARKVIAMGYGESLPGFRAPDPIYPKQSGKLMGKTAREVYLDQSLVVDSSR